jgi:hypothetical protein
LGDEDDGVENEDKMKMMRNGRMLILMKERMRISTMGIKKLFKSMTLVGQD